MTSAALTIGVPTYNRANSLTRLLASLKGLPGSTTVLVSDDASTDGTDDLLAAAAEVRAVRSESNLGYARNFLRLFEACETDYILVTSDDDEVLVDRVGRLIELLSDHRPDFVAPQFLRGTAIYRGRSVSGPIQANEFREASAHAPGLVYRVATCRRPLQELAELIEGGHPAAVIYPQVLLVARLLADGGRCEWWSEPLVRAGAELPSQISADGQSYASLAQRWRQEQAFHDWLAEVEEHAASGAERQAFGDMRAVQDRRLFDALRSGVGFDRPDLLGLFDRGGRRFYSRAAVGGMRRGAARVLKRCVQER